MTSEPGRGSTFTVRLPRMAATSKEVAAPTVAQYAGQREGRMRRIGVLSTGDDAEGHARLSKEREQLHLSAVIHLPPVAFAG